MAAGRKWFGDEVESAVYRSLSQISSMKEMTKEQFAAELSGVIARYLKEQHVSKRKKAMVGLQEGEVAPYSHFSVDVALLPMRHWCRVVAHVIENSGLKASAFADVPNHQLPYGKKAVDGYKQAKRR